MLGICVGSAAYAALTAAAAEGAHLWLHSPIGDHLPQLLLATLLGAAALMPPALLFGLIQAAAIGAYPAGSGVRGRLAGVGGFFAGLSVEHRARGLARPVALTAVVVVLAYVSARLGAETVRSWLPDSVSLSPIIVYAAVMGGLAVLLYVVLHAVALRLLARLLARGVIPTRRVVLLAAFVLASVAAVAVVAGGESVDALGGREPVLYLTFVGAQMAFATALATPMRYARGRWLVARVWIVGLIGLLPAAQVLVFALHREPTVRQALLDDTNIVRRVVGVYQLISDADGDGYSALLGGGDCDDHSARIHPNARDIPGDGIDQDCDGIDPEPPPAVVEPEPLAEEVDHPAYNVLVVTVDTLRADRLSAYGYRRTTSPRIDALAESGALFERFWAQGPNTKFSTSSFLTGKYFSEMRRCGHLWVHIDPSEKTFPEYVQEAGYATAAVPSHRFFQKFSGNMDGFDILDTRVNKKFGRNVNWRPVAQTTTKYAMETLDKLEATGKRWLLWVHYYDPHSAFLRHKGQPNWGGSPSDLYDGEVLYLDRKLAPLLDRLSTPERVDDTAILFHSDHGDGLGDHGYLYHGKTLFDDQLRVPLIARIPGGVARRFAQPTSNIDLAPTILDLMRVPIPDEFRGRSLVPLLLGKATEVLDRPVFAEIARDKKRKPQRALIRWPWKIILHVESGRRTLYNLETDPKEQKNVARSEAAVKARMTVELDDFLENRLEWRAPSEWPSHAKTKTLRN